MKRKIAGISILALLIFLYTLFFDRAGLAMEYSRSILIGFGITAIMGVVAALIALAIHLLSDS